MTESDTRTGAKSALLLSAQQLFILKGYSAVSTREIADHAGVNLGAITYHFGSKAKLFIETVHRLMEERAKRSAFLFSAELPSSRADAAAELALAVRVMLLDGCGSSQPDACRLIYREVHSATSQVPELFEPLMHSVVENYMRPFYERLLSAIQVLQPESCKEEQQFIVHSFLGQCSVYVTHRPFLSYLTGMDPGSREYLEQAARSITERSLRGVGCGSEEVQQALEKAATYEVQ